MISGALALQALIARDTHELEQVDAASDLRASQPAGRLNWTTWAGLVRLSSAYLCEL